MRRNSSIGAILAAACALTVAPGVASAQSGGFGGTDPAVPPAPPSATADSAFYVGPFGSRDLAKGMRGTDVKTLNWVLRGLALGAPLSTDFGDETDGAIRSIQASAAIAADGIVSQPTRKALASRMRAQRASWYGPGFYGNRTACGKRLTTATVGVAHKTLPCGTRVAFAYMGRWVRAKVIDRGPYVKGRTWDLTEPLATQLGTIPAGTAKVKAVVAP